MYYYTIIRTALFLLSSTIRHVNVCRHESVSVAFKICRVFCLFLSVKFSSMFSDTD